MEIFKIGGKYMNNKIAKYDSDDFFSGNWLKNFFDLPIVTRSNVLKTNIRKEKDNYIYEVDGTIAVKELALHPVGLPATVAQSVLAATTEASREWVESFYKMPLRTGKRRYYDNCLYFFAYLALSGNYRMW